MLVWFRSDLRTHDNRALHEAVKYSRLTGARLEAIYCLGSDEIIKQNLGAVRIDFILRTLKFLQSALSALHIPLAFFSFPDIVDYLPKYCKESGVDSVFFNKECDPVAMIRDESIKKAFDLNGISYQDFTDQCIVQEGFVLTKMGKPYAMFTPFKNTWLQYLRENPVKLIGKPDKVDQKISEAPVTIPSSLKGYEIGKECDVASIMENFPAGEEAAIDKLDRFLEETGKLYKDTRNFPAIKGTSMISPYLAIGAISPRFAFELAGKANNGHLISGSEGLQTFIAELCWRDFYRHIMYHFPHITKGEPFKSEAQNIEWRTGTEADCDFERWCNARTGVPIVDAAMNQLTRTGWMHNRLRMIVSMFLTKDLLISWRRGEAWFARHLIDYDWPSNNGGWQWSSSTGTDSQPYFRIFNPFTQSENFDKNGIFIKKYLPELAKVPVSALHDPSGKLSAAEFSKVCPTYPKVIVDHSVARNAALEVFKQAFKKV